MDNSNKKRKGVIMHHSEMLNGKFYEDTINDTTKTDFQPIHASSQKILRHPKALACWYKDGIPDPICAELHPTNECDNMCVYCHFREMHDPPKSLSNEQLMTNITALAENKCKSIIFSGGGEPLKNPYTMPAVARAKRKSMEVGFITNGQLITKEIAEQLVTQCTWIRVSLSATTEKNFRKVRGVDKLKEALNGITQLCLAKMLKHSDVTIGVQWIYTRLETFDELAIFINQWLSKRPIDYLQILVEQSYNSLVLLRQSNLREQASKLKAQFEGKVNIITAKVDDITKQNFGRTYDTCYGHTFVPMIAADNKMYLCCHLLGQEKALIGDLNEKSFNQIWYSKERFRIAQQLNVAECMPLCKHHEINKFLHPIKQPMLHENFL